MGLGAPFSKITEQDLSDRVPAAAGVYGGIVIPAVRGPVDVPTLVTSQSELLSLFTSNGKVEVGYDAAYYSALAFLAQSNKLWVVRSATAATYSGAGVAVAGAALPFTATAAFADPAAFTFTAEALLLHAANQGTWGAGIYAQVFPYFTAADVNNPQAGTEDPFNVGEPGAFRIEVYAPDSVQATTTWVAATAYTAQAAVVPTVVNGFYYTNTGGTSGAAEPVFPTVANATVVDGTVTWTAVQLVQSGAVEVWTASRTATHLDGFGRSIFVDNVLNGSQYIDGISNIAVADTILPAYTPAPMALGIGSNGTAVTDGAMVTSLGYLNDTIQFPMTVLLDGGRATATYQKALIALAEARNDCVALLGVPFDAESNAAYMANVVGYRKGTGVYTTATGKVELNANSSFAAIYAGSLLVADGFNDREIYVSPDGYVGGAIAKMERNTEIWFAPAGDRRGKLNVLDVYKRYTSGEADVLYNNGINPIKNIPGKGIEIYGQKTLQTRPSDLDRLNVRLMLITIEPAVNTAMAGFLFEFNDADTRLRVRTMIDSYMGDIKARRGVFDYKVVCDSTNNTAVVISQNRLEVMLLLKVSKAAEFISTVVGITPRGVSFETAANQL